jgi:glycosyltransferase involved in cell wall biosynthesis
MGGDGVFLYRLSNALAAAGHEVHIVHCIDAYFAKRSAPNEGIWDHHPNVTIHRLKSRAGFLSPLVTLVSGHPGLKTRKLNDIFEMDFDVIHHHTVSLMGAPALFEMGDAIKLLKMTTYWLLCPTSYLFKYEREICEKKSCFSCSVLAAKRPPQLWRYTNALENKLPHLDMLLANSRFSQRLHADAFPNARVEWLPNFTIDIAEKDSPDDPVWKAYTTENRSYFLCVGRLVYNKGVHVLIDAMRDVPDRELVIAGDGPYRKQLERLAQDNPRIHFLGECTPARLKSLYRHAAALVVPSIWHETFGNVAIEAMRQRLPIIVHNVGGLTEYVTEHKAGWLYNNRDELHQLLMSFDENSEVARNHGIEGEFAVNNVYSESAHLERYLGLIAELKREKAMERNNRDA